MIIILTVIFLMIAVFCGFVVIQNINEEINRHNDKWYIRMGDSFYGLGLGFFVMGFAIGLYLFVLSLT